MLDSDSELSDDDSLDFEDDSDDDSEDDLLLGSGSDLDSLSDLLHSDEDLLSDTDDERDDELDDTDETEAHSCVMHIL